MLAQQAGAARALWNLIHAHHTFHASSKRWPSWSDSDAAIRQARKDGQEVALQDVEPNATRQAAKRQNPKTAA